MKNLVWKGFENTKEFSVVVSMTPVFDNEIARQEVVDDVLELVFDFITLIKWMPNAVMQRPYAGWM